jgi:hypothetical protein
MFRFLLLFSLTAPLSLSAQADANLSLATAERFAKLALACVHKEYPNKISHVMNDDGDIAPPRRLTPAFYGCYDWHSSVHGHWLLARLARTFPDAPFAVAARDALQQSLTPDHIKSEVIYLNGQGRTTFERPYGLAWLLQLGQELREWDDPIARILSANLKPLEESAILRLSDWLPKLTNPIRIGEHNQTAFSFGLLLDGARSSGNKSFEDLLTKKVREFYFRDRSCPLSYEPSGEDFLSPCIAEADVMRRVLSPREFQTWLHAFLPQIPGTETVFLKPAVVTDPTDPKLAHLDGLNLSRSWMLEGIASALPPKDPRIAAIVATAAAHKQKGLAAVTGEHYEGGHWLGSFAVYLVTQRGIALKK